MAEAKHLTEARALYQCVVARYLCHRSIRCETESDRASSPPDVGMQDSALKLLLAMPYSHRRTRDL